MKAIALIAAAALCCGVAHAQVPRLINYQGLLTSPGGTPVNATVPMKFRLYDGAAAGATQLYSETQSVVVTNGLFDVQIGAVAPLGLAFDVPYWLGVTVGLVDPEMTPRQPLGASGYAITAASAQSLAPGASVGSAQIADHAITQAKLSPLSGATAGSVLGTDGSQLRWQGPAPSAANYVFVYDNTTQPSLMPNLPQPLPFSTVALLDGWLFIADNNDFTATASGLYRIRYSVNLQATSTSRTAALRLVVNGIEVPGSGVGVSFAVANVPVLATQEALVSIAAGDVLTLVFSGSDTGVQTIAPTGPLATPTSATLLIERIR